LILHSCCTQVWKVNASLHILLVSMHHSITDGWSVSVMQSELAAAYAAACSGAQPGWEQLPVQVVDYAAWQRSHLQLAEELAWWTDTLAGAPPLLELPYDRPRPDVFSHRGAHVQLALSNVAASDLAQLAAQHRTTSFVVALTALQVCVHISLCGTALHCVVLHCLHRIVSSSHDAAKIPATAGPACKV
jgi:Condensation domain